MNCCGEVMKMGVPRAAQALAPRAGQPQGVGSEAYLNGTSQGELVLNVAEGTPEAPGRTAIFLVAVGHS